MIIGNGVDLVEINRISNLIERKPQFIKRIFTEKEIVFFQSKGMKHETIAANFAAKEAVSKALGTGIRGFDFKDIEILRTDLGQPYVKLLNGAEDLAHSMGINQWHISLSHTEAYAIAFVVAEKESK